MDNEHEVCRLVYEVLFCHQKKKKKEQTLSSPSGWKKLDDAVQSVTSQDQEDFKYSMLFF